MSVLLSVRSLTVASRSPSTIAGAPGWAHEGVRTMSSGRPSSSRTRLAKDLSPRSTARHADARRPSKFLKVAPRAPFDRESLPHSEIREKDMSRDSGRPPREGGGRPERRDGSYRGARDGRDDRSASRSKSRWDGDTGDRRDNWKDEIREKRDDWKGEKRDSWKDGKRNSWKSEKGDSWKDGKRDNWKGEKSGRWKGERNDSWKGEKKDSWRGDGESREQPRWKDSNKPGLDGENRGSGRGQRDRNRSANDRPSWNRDSKSTSNDDSHPAWRYRPDREDRPRRSSGGGAYARAAEAAVSHVEGEFDFSTEAEPVRTLPAQFASPPLADGLLRSVHDVLGENARPTPIQALALKHLFSTPDDSAYRQFLLASETGSGKSIAYLLPMLQALKEAEQSDPQPLRSQYAMNPRGLILAPTHELARQLSSFAKALIHNIKLRVRSASRANIATSSVQFGGRGRVSASKMSGAFGSGQQVESGEFEVSRGGAAGYEVDLLVGTPSKILEFARGNGWDKQFEEGEEERAKKWVVDRPQMGLANVEWVVIDEADILFDSDFVDETLLLLSDIATARGSPVPLLTAPPTNTEQAAATPPPSPVAYPFNFLLTSATIPTSLASHLDTYHPKMTRLVSPDLHHLPKNLALEFAPYASGNRNADVAAKIRNIWEEDALAGRERSRVLVFGNTRNRVEEMGKYLDEHKVANVVVTGAGGRLHGSNRHLAGFLKPKRIVSDSEGVAPTPPSPPSTVVSEKADEDSDIAETPRVLLSTSLLARGLDFDPSVAHVLVLEPPRNTADFLHRAGRTARAGQKGHVVVFGKGGGRGADRVRQMKSRVAALKTR